MIKIKPGLDAGFFASLSMVDEKSLLQTVNALGVRRDLVSMHGFLDFLERECKEGDISDLDIFHRIGIPIQQPHTHIDRQCDKNEPRGTLARALVQPFKEYFDHPMELLNEESMVYALRMVEVLQKLPDDFRQDALDLALFEACDLTRDARVFEVLVAAGANSAALMTSRIAESNAKPQFMISEIAIQHANYTAAWEMAQKDQENEDLSYVVEMAVADMQKPPKPNPSASALGNFLDNPSARSMVRSLAQDGRDNRDLAQLMALMEERIDANTFLVDQMESFRVGLMAGYLEQVRLTSAALWDPRMLEMAAGPKGLDSDGPLAVWIRRQVEEGEGLKTNQMVHCLAREAIQSHCVPALALCTPFLAHHAKDPVQAMTEGIGFLFAVQEAKRSSRPQIPPRPLTDPARFLSTLRTLQGLGWDPNADVQFYGIRSRPLSLCAKIDNPDSMLVKLPALLALGCDPKAVDAAGMMASDFVGDSRAKERWLAIEASFRARNAAMSILDDLDNETPTPSKMHP